MVNRRIPQLKKENIAQWINIDWVVWTLWNLWSWAIPVALTDTITIELYNIPNTKIYLVWGTTSSWTGFHATINSNLTPIRIATLLWWTLKQFVYQSSWRPFSSFYFWNWSAWTTSNVNASRLIALELN